MKSVDGSDWRWIDGSDWFSCRKRLSTRSRLFGCAWIALSNCCSLSSIVEFVEKHVVDWDWLFGNWIGDVWFWLLAKNYKNF